MRFRPANISLINRRHYLPRLLLTLSSFEKNDQRTLTGHYISTSGLAVNGPEPGAIACDKPTNEMVRRLILLHEQVDLTSTSC